jgi:hypothetical protein
VGHNCNQNHHHGSNWLLMEESDVHHTSHPKLTRNETEMIRSRQTGSIQSNNSGHHRRHRRTTMEPAIRTSRAELARPGSKACTSPLWPSRTHLGQRALGRHRRTTQPRPTHCHASSSCIVGRAISSRAQPPVPSTKVSLQTAARGAERGYVPAAPSPASHGFVWRLPREAMREGTRGGGWRCRDG